MGRTSKVMGRNENNAGTWCTLKSGNIRHQKWYTAKNGAKKRLGVTAKTQAECKRLMKAEEERFELTSRVELSTEGLLEVEMRFWLDNIKKSDPKCGDSQYNRLDSAFNTHIKNSYLGKTKENQIKDKDIVKFMSELKKHTYSGKILDEPLSYSSKKKVYDLLNMYFKHKYIRASELNPMLSVSPPIKDRYIKNDDGIEVENDDITDLETVPLNSVWNDEQMLAIHKYCMRPFQNGKKGSVKRGPLIAFIMWTFTRSNEARALRWSDLCLEEGNEHIKVTKSWKKRKVNGRWEWYLANPKSKRSKRIIPLIPQAVEAINEYKRRFPPKSENDFICLNDDGDVLCGNNFNEGLKCVLKGLGFEDMVEKDKRVHGLRHAGISYLIRKQVPLAVVSTLAGHSSLSITEQVYIEIISEYCKEEIIKLNITL